MSVNEQQLFGQQKQKPTLCVKKINFYMSKKIVCAFEKTRVLKQYSQIKFNLL